MTATGIPLGFLAVMALALILGPATARNPHEGEFPPDAAAMIEHVAIIGQVTEVCEATRPDLAEALAAANTAWWLRTRA